MLGYNVASISGDISSYNYVNTSLETLSKALILHPIAAGKSPDDLRLGPADRWIFRYRFLLLPYRPLLGPIGIHLRRSHCLRSIDRLPSRNG